tara:strand:+ start:316 stop:1017 length:702 start_codon:yes stop_codon:yes gene_type:complete
MKQIILVLLFSISFSAYSQDQILKKNGDDISCNVIEISDISAKYTLPSNTNLNYVVNLSDILVITFENGEKLIPGLTKNTKDKNVFSGVIPAQTSISIETQKFLTAKKAKQGELFDVRVKHDVMDATGTVLLFKAGTMAQGIVTGVTKNKSLGRPGSLSIGIEYITAIDGQSVPVSLFFSDEGESRAGAAVGIGALLFLPALLIKGEAPEIPAGTVLTAKTVSAFTLEEQLAE